MGNTRCKGCKSIILDDGKKCPLCGATTRSLFDRFSQLFGEFFKLIYYVLLSVVLIIGAAFLWSAYGTSKDHKGGDRETCSESVASEMAREFIRVRLGPKSDPVFSDADVNIPRAQKEAGCRFIAYGKLSAIVGGEHIKAGYIAQVFLQDTPNGRVWRLKDITYTAP